MSMESDCVASKRVRCKSFTAQEEKELLDKYFYVPETGEFFWKTDGGRWGESKAGTKAGHSDGYGRWKLCFGKRRTVLAYRFAFLFMTGEWPSEVVDHIDGNPSNDKWLNLRQATFSQNSCNRGKSRTNKSGFKGVSLNGKNRITGIWRASIGHQGKNYILGRFNTPEEASRAYDAAAIRFHGEFVNFGKPYSCVLGKCPDPQTAKDD